MNTYKSLSKQTTLTLFRINTYEKRGWVLWLTDKPALSSASRRLWSRARGQETLAAGVEQREKRQQSRHGNESPQDAVRRPHKLHGDVLRPRRQPQDHLAAGLCVLRCYHRPVHFHAPRRIVQQPQRHLHR